MHKNFVLLFMYKMVFNLILLENYMIYNNSFNFFIDNGSNILCFNFAFRLKDEFKFHYNFNNFKVNENQKVDEEVLKSFFENYFKDIISKAEKLNLTPVLSIVRGDVYNINCILKSLDFNVDAIYYIPKFDVKNSDLGGKFSLILIFFTKDRFNLFLNDNKQLVKITDYEIIISTLLESVNWNKCNFYMQSVVYRKSSALIFNDYLDFLKSYNFKVNICTIDD